LTWRFVNSVVAFPFTFTIPPPGWHLFSSILMNSIRGRHCGRVNGCCCATTFYATTMPVTYSAALSLPSVTLSLFPILPARACHYCTFTARGDDIATPAATRVSLPFTPCTFLLLPFLPLAPFYITFPMLYCPAVLSWLCPSSSASASSWLDGCRCCLGV